MLYLSIYPKLFCSYIIHIRIYCNMYDLMKYCILIISTVFSLTAIGMRALDSDKGMLNAGGRLAERDVVQFVA